MTVISVDFRKSLCKKLAIFLKQFSSFNPLGKEDLKWSMVTLKPRYSEQMESGVLYFVVPAKAQSEKWGVRGGNKVKAVNN